MKRLIMMSLAVLSAVGTGKATAELKDTVFGRIADRYDLPVNLLYSVALAESAYQHDSGIRPWPYTLRTQSTAYYARSQGEAESILNDLLKTARSIDIGVMQVNLRWNRDRIEDPLSLLNFEQGLRLGAQILRERIDSAPGDLELGVGRYHQIKNEARARNYGARVLAICNNVSQALGGGCEP